MNARKQPGVFASALLCLLAPFAMAADETPGVSALKNEVAAKGWIIYCARSDNGTWDLFLSRPDGAAARNLTNTPDFEEAAPRFSPDSTRLLYRRLAKASTIDHDKWGFTGELVVANPDTTEARAVGKEGEFPWASWMPDGNEVVCLEKKGIRFINLESGETTRQMPRSGIYQQLFISPDGRWLCGTGNVNAEAWNVVRMNAESGAINPVHIFQSCTPDWMPDSQRLIYSSRPQQKNNEGYGCTQLWIADGDGKNAHFIYGDESFHIYGGRVSPDALYVLFTKSPKDGGGSEAGGAPIFLMRLADTPAIGGASPELRGLYPETKDGPEVELATGWEPDWTYAEVGAK